MSDVWKHLVISMAATTGTATLAANGDWAHVQIQQFLSDIRGGFDFGQPEFSEIVAKDDAEKLLHLKSCTLKDVSRTPGDPIALVNFLCGEQKQTSVSAMLSFQDNKISRIEVMQSVFVNAKQ